MNQETLHTIVVVTIVPAVTGLINMVLASKTDEQWVAFAESNPRLAAFSKFLKAVGFNPVGAVKALRAMFTKKES